MDTSTVLNTRESHPKSPRTKPLRIRFTRVIDQLLSLLAKKSLWYFSSLKRYVSSYIVSCL